MKYRYLLIIAILIFYFRPIITYSQEKLSENLIREVLVKQEMAWNEGDLESYMNGYWNNDSLRFIGKSGIQYGWKTTLENYKKSYPDLATMGKLKFDIISIELMSESTAFVIGEWHLTREKGNIEGCFTLVFRFIDHNWVIVCDHSS